MGKHYIATLSIFLPQSATGVTVPITATSPSERHLITRSLRPYPLTPPG